MQKVVVGVLQEKKVKPEFLNPWIKFDFFELPCLLAFPSYSFIQHMV
jgi:hypothetical protein